MEEEEEEEEELERVTQARCWYSGLGNLCHVRMRKVQVYRS